METVSKSDDAKVILVNGSLASKDTEDEKMKPMHIQDEYLSKTLMKKYRWIMLVFVSVLYASIYFNMDAISVLQYQIEDKFDVLDYEFDFLYSMYGFPNFVLPLFAGILFDKIGIRIGLTVFFTITVIGIGC
jgi:MFS family permease